MAALIAADNQYARDTRGVDAVPPPVDVCYFHTLVTDIENVKQVLASETRPRPLSSADNKAVEKVWLQQRRVLRVSKESMVAGDQRDLPNPNRDYNHENSPQRQASASKNPVLQQSSSEGLTGNPFVRAPSQSDPQDIGTRSSVLISSSEDEQASTKQYTAAEQHVIQASQQQDVAVGATKLHKVTLPNLTITPIYWRPVNDTSSVLRGSWFFKDDMLPIHPDIANLLEMGYLRLRPWTQTWKDELRSAIKVGATGEEKVLYHLWPRSLSSNLPSRPTTRDSRQSASRSEDLRQVHETNALTYAFQRIEEVEKHTGLDSRALGSLSFSKCGSDPKYQNAAVIYIDSYEAVILRPSLQPSNYFGRRPLANYISKGRSIGIAVRRGFDRNKWNSLNRSINSASSKTHPTPKAFVAAEVVEANEDGRLKSGKDTNPAVVDLILVVHGIGQKLSESVESYNFIRVINGLRGEVNAEVASRSVLTGSQSEIITLPVNWRSQLSFEDDETSMNTCHSPRNKFSLGDITPDELAPVRSIVSDVMLDIPLYLSNHRPKMIQAVIDEANRIYHLWCQHNPSFISRGRVHFVAHSLGSLMMLDILSKQPTSVQADPSNRHTGSRFAFDTTNLTLCGSPAGVFLLLEQAALLPRRDSHKVLQENFIHLSKVAGEQGTQGCIAVDNVYNIINPYDPVAYHLNATVDASWAAALKTAYLPGSSASWFPLSDMFTSRAAVNISTNEARPRPTPRLPSNVEMETHDFTAEEIAQERAYLLNDNGQVDYLLRYSAGPIGLKYLTMLGAHSSYWVSKDFVRFLVTETLRPPGREGTLPVMRAARKKT